MVNVPQGFFRFSGVLMIISALIGGVVMMLHLDDTPASLQELPHFLTLAVWSHVWLFIGIGMMLVALPALFLRDVNGLKWWGWLAFGLMFVSFFFDACHAVLQMFDYPVVFQGIDNDAKLKEVSEMVMKVQMGMPGNFFMAISGPTLLLGTLLMGISLFTAKGVSRRPAIATLVLFVALLGMFFAPEWYIKILLTCYYLHFAWYGAGLVFERNHVSGQLPA
ncbi:hypothetical protein [Paenibacillus sedimenti]|uniref:DUF4386 family protein n=1 Tax=Paenibacillus sedimenti TaxID=2770274 RepID=A0A926QMJ5_9BACL|nr:hypothetical protein [Paenibacillus sedimenti]MBD0383757.1 hypothetical protein [Paenibacillus sedimenti]